MSKNNHQETEEAVETSETIETNETIETTETPSVEILDENPNEASLAKTNEELLDKLQRTLAEFDNFRKRTAKEKAALYDLGVSDTVEKILPVVDNFKRALESLDPHSDIHKGILMIYHQFEGFLKDIGIEAINCENQPFDPSLHHAVASVDNPNYASGEIVEELLKGYKYKDKVIRHSMVQVAN